MKTRVYNATLEDLMDFMVDVQTTFSVNIQTKEMITRISVKDNHKYTSTLESVSPQKITPSFNIYHNDIKKESTIAAYIPNFTLGLRLKYTNSSTICGFSFEIPSTRILVKIKDTKLENFVSDFYKGEEYLEKIVETYLSKTIDDLFVRKIIDNDSQEWVLDCKTYRTVIEKGSRINY